jgi:hypothetical protein
MADPKFKLRGYPQPPTRFAKGRIGLTFSGKFSQEIAATGSLGRSIASRIRPNSGVPRLVSQVSLRFPAGETWAASRKCLGVLHPPL